MAPYADGETLHYSPPSSSYLNSVPTVALRARNEESPYAEWRAASQVQNLEQVGRGLQTSFDTDDNDVNFYMYKPRIGPVVETFVVKFDGYLYGNMTNCITKRLGRIGRNIGRIPVSFVG